MTTSPVIWTLFVGPFVGAILAFALARIYDAGRRFNEQLAAANLALLTLKNQYNDFTSFRRGFYEDCSRLTLNGEEPTWALLRPNFIRYGDYEFNYKEIAFLFESGTRPTVFDAIEEAQILHRDLLKMDEQRTDTARETQRMVAKEVKDSPMALEDAEKIIGKAMVAELNMLVEGLAMRAVFNERAYLKAFSSLRDSLHDHIKQTWRYRIGYLYRMRHDATVEQMLLQKSVRLNKGFNADELPALPKSLQARVDEMIVFRNGTKP